MEKTTIIDPILINLPREQIELLSYMAKRYETTIDGLIEDAIHEWYSEEDYEYKKARKEGER